MKLLGWVHRKFRPAAAAGDLRRELRLDDDDGGYPYPQPSLDELHTCCRLNHPRPPSLHRPPSFSNDGGCSRLETSLPGEQRPRSMDDHVPLAHRHIRVGPQLGLLAIGTFGMDPSCLEGPATPHLRFPFHSILFLAQKEQSTSEAAEEDDVTEQEEALQPETDDENGSAGFSPGELPPPQKVEAAGGSGGRGRENQGEKKERTLTGAVKKVLKRQGSKAGDGGGGGGGRENQAEKKERTLTSGLKKVLKRRGSKAGAVARDSGPAAAPSVGSCREGTPQEESKLYKLLKIFHKKVHPEGSIARKENKSSRFSTPVGAAYPSDGGGSDDEANGISRIATRKEGGFCDCRRWTRPLESVSLESTSSCGGDSNGRGEHFLWCFLNLYFWYLPLQIWCWSYRSTEEESSYMLLDTADLCLLCCKLVITLQSYLTQIQMKQGQVLYLPLVWHVLKFGFLCDVLACTDFIEISVHVISKLGMIFCFIPL